MADFHIDHDVALDVTRLIRTYGHTAVTARDLGLTRAKDYTHLLVAARAGRILVTRNWEDFKLLHFAWLEWSFAWGVIAQHHGILAVDQSPADRIAQELDAFVGTIQSSGQSLTDRLFRWRVTTGWVERIRP
jgi:hypothetical protein